jgi:transcriptional regulator with XRE-family HTH domain
MKNRIRELRKNNKMTLKQLGKMVGMAESTMSLYETAGRQPDVTILAQIADIFSVSIDYLLYRTDDPRPYDPPATEEEIKSTASMLGRQPGGMLKASDHITENIAPPVTDSQRGIYYDGLPPEAIAELKNFSDYVLNKYKK